jgi:hypothetical protein
MILAAVALIQISPAFAGSVNTLNSTYPYFSTSIKISQPSAPISGNLVAGSANFEIIISNIAPKFDRARDISQYFAEDMSKWKKGNGPYCEAIPYANPNQNGSTFDIDLFVKISDNEKFIKSESSTYFSAGVRQNLDLAGTVKGYSIFYFDRDDKGVSKYNLEANPFVDTSFSYIALKPVNLEIKKQGLLYIQISTRMTQMITGGKDCPIRNNAQPYYLVYEESIQQVNVTKRDQYISASATLPVPLANKVYRTEFSSSSGLPVTAREINSTICISNGDLVHLLSAGKCQIKLSQAGNDVFNSTQEVILEFEVTPPIRNKTITCVKGKMIKKVTAASPKCPTGYKKKT